MPVFAPSGIFLKIFHDARCTSYFRADMTAMRNVMSKLMRKIQVVTAIPKRVKKTLIESSTSDERQCTRQCTQYFLSNTGQRDVYDVREHKADHYQVPNCTKCLALGS